MKKVMLLLFAFCSILAYSAKTVDYQEVDKYVRQKLDKDKEITFTYKVNQADFTLEGYSDGKLTAVTDLKSNPGQAAMDGMKSVVSEKNGKLNPEYKIFAADGKLLSEQKYDIKTLSGKTEFFYPNGKLFSTMNVKNGILDGETKLYYENGKLKLIANNKNGKMNGIVTTYSEDGKVIKKIEVKDGEVVREIQ